MVEKRSSLDPGCWDPLSLDIPEPSMLDIGPDVDVEHDLGFASLQQDPLWVEEEAAIPLNFEEPAVELGEDTGLGMGTSYISSGSSDNVDGFAMLSHRQETRAVPNASFGDTTRQLMMEMMVINGLPHAAKRDATLKWIRKVKSTGSYDYYQHCVVLACQMLQQKTSPLSSPVTDKMHGGTSSTDEPTTAPSPHGPMKRSRFEDSDMSPTWPTGDSYKRQCTGGSFTASMATNVPSNASPYPRIPSGSSSLEEIEMELGVLMGDDAPGRGVAGRHLDSLASNVHQFTHKANNSNWERHSGDGDATVGFMSTLHTMCSDGQLVDL